MHVTRTSILREFDLTPDALVADGVEVFDSHVCGPDGTMTRFARRMTRAKEQWNSSTLIMGQDVELGSGEDPRAFLWQDRICASAMSFTLPHGHINRLYLADQDRWVVLVVPKKLVPGKNWAPFVQDDALHFIHAYAPFRVLKAQFLDPRDNYMVLTVVAEHPMAVRRSHDGFSALRGGSPAVQIGQAVVGFGHTNERTRGSGGEIVHRPFLFVYRPGRSVRYYDIGAQFETDMYIVDPTGLYFQDGRLHLTTCETQYVWDKQPQSGRICRYEVTFDQTPEGELIDPVVPPSHAWIAGKSDPIGAVRRRWYSVSPW